ncbi:MAG: hypothetical protein WCO84_03885 [bacterium]
MNKNKIIFIIIVSLVVVLGIGGTVWYLNNQIQPQTNTPVTNPVTTTDNGTGAFPSSDKIIPVSTPTNQQNTIDNTAGADTVERVPGEITRKADVGVAGVAFIDNSFNGAGPLLRYIEKGTGHISDISYDEKIPTKISNTTMTGVFDTVWNKDASSLIIRRLDGVGNNIQTIYGNLERGFASTTIDGEVGSIVGTILPSSVKEIAVSPLKDKIFFLSKNGNSTIGSISDFNRVGASNKKNQIFSSAFSDWSVSWPTTNSISLVTKPGYNVSGYFYSLGVSNNKLEKVIGDISGLTTLMSPSGDKTIYSETTGAGFMTYYTNKSTDYPNIMPITTLPEKCVWSKINENVVYCGVPKTTPLAKYPDSWYQGVTSFSDNIYEINLDTNSARVMIDDQKLGGIEIDVTNPILSTKEDYLAFINKKDNTPFMVKIR